MNICPVGVEWFQAGGRTNGRTYRYDRTNSRFSQFDERTWKGRWVKCTYTAGPMNKCKLCKHMCTSHMIYIPSKIISCNYLFGLLNDAVSN